MLHHQPVMHPAEPAVLWEDFQMAEYADCRALLQAQVGLYLDGSHVVLLLGVRILGVVGVQLDWCRDSVWEAIAQQQGGDGHRPNSLQGASGLRDSAGCSQSWHSHGIEQLNVGLAEHLRCGQQWGDDGRTS